MKVGCAHVKGLYTYPAASGTQLKDGCDVIASLSQQVLKIYLTKDYTTDYPLQTAWGGTPANLTQLAQLAVFADRIAEFDDIIFTTFTFANGTTNWWRVQASNANLQAEYTEIYNLAVHLLTTYNNSGKHFTIQNWEGDWAFMDAFTPDTRVDRAYVDYYAAFLNVRQRAVSDARKATAHSNVTVKNAVEVNRVVDSRLRHRARILTSLKGRINPDVLSFSAYDATIVDQGGWGASTSAWQTATEPVFRDALRTIKRAFPLAEVQIGEFGYPENEAPGGHDIPEMILTTYTVALEQGCTRFIYWQVFDNEPNMTYTYRGYWYVKPDGTITSTGAKMLELAGL